MKTGFVIRKAGFLGLLLGFSSSTAFAAAIGLSINPSVFTNNYVGQVTFRITNLTPGMTVTVDEFADLNTNGVIDAGDLHVTTFQLTDGQASLVAGVTNLNVPGDDDGLTNGQILMHYNYPDVGGGLWAGKFLIRVTDPSNILTSATQAVSVVQYVYPQAITGRATVSGLPLTNCPVAAVSYASETPVTMTDTNGHYTIYGVPPAYSVFGFNEQAAVFNEFLIVSLSCGQTATNNLAITPGAFTISGKVTDSSTGVGVAHLQMDANTPDDFDVVSLTDGSGNYSLQVTPDTWRVHPSTGTAATRGYVDQTRMDVTISNASVSGINFSLSKPTALIYGTVKDTLGNPVFGVQVSTRDFGGSFHPLGRSFAPDGSYSIGVQANTWTGLGLNSADLALQGFTGTNADDVTLVAGQATNVNFVVTRTNWPSLTQPVHVSSSQFQFLLNGLAGQAYTIQTITNLASTNWLALLTTNAPCNSVFILDSQATNGQRFYRALVVP